MKNPNLVLKLLRLGDFSELEKVYKEELKLERKLPRKEREEVLRGEESFNNIELKFNIIQWSVVELYLLERESDKRIDITTLELMDMLDSALLERIREHEHNIKDDLYDLFLIKEVQRLLIPFQLLCRSLGSIIVDINMCAILKPPTRH